MKCPLLYAGPVDAGFQPNEKWGDCLDEECAWWNDRFGMCSQAVPAYLAGVADRRAEIHEKMEERRRS